MSVKFDGVSWIDRTAIYCFGGKPKLPPPPDPPKKSDAEILMEETTRRRRAGQTGPIQNILTGPQGVTGAPTTGKATLGGS